MKILSDLEFHERFINPHRYTLNWIGPELSGGGKSFSRFLQIRKKSAEMLSKSILNSKNPPRCPQEPPKNLPRRSQDAPSSLQDGPFPFPFTQA